MVPIVVTLVGILTDVRDVHDEKAEAPNDSGYGYHQSDHSNTRYTNLDLDYVVVAVSNDDDNNNNNNNNNDSTNTGNTRRNSNRCK